MMFTLGPTFAHTIQFIWQVILGITLAWCNIWFVDGLLDGSPSNDGEKAFVWSMYCVGIVAFLYFNLGNRAQLIGLHVNSSYMMMILNPSVKDRDYIEIGSRYIY